MSERTLQEKGFVSYLPIVITCVIFAFVSAAMQASCMGIFYPAMVEDYGVPTSTLTLYLTVGGLILAIWAPILGKIMVSVDVRIIASAMTLWAAGCFALLSVVQTFVQVFIVSALLVPVAVTYLSIVAPTLINRWFKDRAGAIIGFVAAFTGIGGVVFIQVGNAIMEASGYRTAFLVYAVIILIACLPFTIFAIRNRPEDRGMLPYVSPKSAKAGASEAVAKKDWTVNVKAAFRSPAFWLVALCGGFANMTVLLARFYPTYVNELQAAGVAVIITGATLATIVSAGQAVCKFVVGAGSDFDPVKTIMIACGLGAVGILCIWFGPTSFIMPMGGFIFGFFYASTSVIMPILGGAVFGTGKNFSVIYGRSVAVTSIFALPGGFMWPLIAETFGGYEAAFALAVCMIVVFAIMAYAAIKLGKKIPRDEVA